jgi:hypothetical protein
MGVGGQRHALAALPRERNPAPIAQKRLGGSQGRIGRVRKISPPLRFDPGTVYPVASRCTDYATPVKKPLIGQCKHVLPQKKNSWQQGPYTRD